MINETEIYINFYCDEEYLKKKLNEWRSGISQELEGHEGRWLITSFDMQPNQNDSNFSCSIKYSRIFSIA